MAKYIVKGKEVTEEEFNKQVFKLVEESPFFLDEIVSISFTPKSEAETEQILNEIRKIAGKKNKTEETLEDILKRNMNIGAPNWNESNTGGTVFEKVQDSSVPPYVDRMEDISKEYSKTLENIYCGNFNNHKFTIEGLGVKETENKVDYSEIDWQFITQLAERMNKNKDKYEPGNWKKLIDVELLKQSLLRHVIAVLNSNYEDDGRPQGHLEAIALNAQMINYQLKNK